MQQPFTYFIILIHKSLSRMQSNFHAERIKTLKFKYDLRLLRWLSSNQQSSCHVYNLHNNKRSGIIVVCQWTAAVNFSTLSVCTSVPPGRKNKRLVFTFNKVAAALSLSYWLCLLLLWTAKSILPSTNRSHEATTRRVKLCLHVHPHVHSVPVFSFIYFFVFLNCKQSLRGWNAK